MAAHPAPRAPGAAAAVPPPHDCAQDLTVLWTDIERVLAEMEQAVKAVSEAPCAHPGLTPYPSPALNHPVLLPAPLRWALDGC